MVFNQVVTIHDGQKIPVYTSLYFLSQNSQPSFPHFVPGDSLSALCGEDAVPSPAILCHSAAVSRVSGRGETWSPRSDLGLRLPTAPRKPETCEMLHLPFWSCFT